MHFIKNVFTAVTVLSGMTAAMPVVQAGGLSDYSVHCSSGFCTEKDLEAISKAIELASTNPDAVSWSVNYKADDDKVTRDGTSTIDITSTCAAGKCTQEDLDSLKSAYDSAKSEGSDDVSAAGFKGSLDFSYGFKYEFSNASAPAV